MLVHRPTKLSEMTCAVLRASSLFTDRNAIPSSNIHLQPYRKVCKNTYNPCVSGGFSRFQ